MKTILLTAVLGLGAIGAGWASAQTAPVAAPKAKADPHDHGDATPRGREAGSGMGMGGGMMGGGMMMGGGACPMMGGGEVKVEVKNIDKGVTVTWTATDAAKVTRLQKWAAATRLMHEAMSP